MVKNPEGLFQQSQQVDNNPFSQGQPQSQQADPAQAPATQPESDGVAGWIKDMFGNN